MEITGGRDAGRCFLSSFCRGGFVFIDEYISSDFQFLIFVVGGYICDLYLL